jgi:hypothetical protein
MLGRRYLATLALSIMACGGDPPGGTGGTDDDGGGGGGAGNLRVEITDPGGDISILAGDTVDLSAAFFDGDLAVGPSSVTWTSSRDDELGTTNPLNDVALSTGTHTITVRGTLGSKTGSDTIKISVGEIYLEIFSPNQGDSTLQGGTVTFAALAIHADATGLSADGSFGRNALYEWSSSLDGAFGGDANGFDYTALTVGTHVITLRVTDDDTLNGGTGATATASVTITIRAPNTAPVVDITAPAACPATQDLAEGSILAFTATAVDAEDGALTGEWHDSMTGEVVDGNGLTFGDSAAVGKHTLTFRATDAAGVTSDQSCSVYVIPAGQSRDDLFPSTNTINTELSNIDDVVRWVGGDPSGNTWIATDARLHVFDSAQAEVSGPYDGDTGSLNVDPGNQDVRVNDAVFAGAVALVATEAGLARCSYAAGALSSCAQASGQNFRAVATNNDASLVAAGSDAGLFLAAYTGAMQTASVFVTDANSNLPSNNVRDVLLAGTTLYVATSDGLCIAEAAAAAIAAPGALCTTILDEDNSVLPSDNVRALLMDGDVLWIGTDSGLVRYNPSSGSMIVYDEGIGLADDSIRAIAIDDDGILWLGTDDGMSRLDRSTLAVTNFTEDDWGGADPQVNSIFIDGNGDKWIGTSEGVFRYSPD